MWARYDNRATGLSFRYPRYLRIRERDPRSFGLTEVEEITELLGDTKLNPGTVVLRFMVNRGEATPKRRRPRPVLRVRGMRAIRTTESLCLRCNWTATKR